jgi:hypothetical protein
MMDLPPDHFTNFSEAWWTERRKRDYFINEDGRVKVLPGSDTDKYFCAKLRVAAMQLAAELS